MVEYAIGFSKIDVPGMQVCHELLYNTSRLISHQGELSFGPDKLYFFYTNPVERTVNKPWSVDYNEIASYGKSGLAGYLITLKDGKVLRFSNVFRKMRNAITETLDKLVR